MSERIEKLRQAAFANYHKPSPELNYLNCAAYLETAGECLHELRRAKMDAIVLDRYSIEIEPGDLLPGRFSRNFE
ncbi:MAG: hypothetical protein LBL83_06385, partial [Clostridiales bacterium]|nr:hypothetical protein [Clostridiales bacterium]